MTYWLWFHHLYKRLKKCTLWNNFLKSLVLHLSFDFVSRNGDRDDAANVAIVITDGVSNINARRTIPEAEQSRDIGIKIYAVGIGLTDTRELLAIASTPADDHAFAVNDFDQLAGLENQLFGRYCQS